MDKLLLTIEVPSVEQIFDFTAPKTITPGLMRELLYQVLAELTGGPTSLPAQNCCAGAKTGRFCPRKCRWKTAVYRWATI